MADCTKKALEDCCINVTIQVAAKKDNYNTRILARVAKEVTGVMTPSRAMLTLERACNKAACEAARLTEASVSNWIAEGLLDKDTKDDES